MHIVYWQQHYIKRQFKILFEMSLKVRCRKKFSGTVKVGTVRQPRAVSLFFQRDGALSDNCWIKQTCDRTSDVDMGRSHGTVLVVVEGTGLNQSGVLKVFNDFLWFTRFPTFHISVNLAGNLKSTESFFRFYDEGVWARLNRSCVQRLL